MEIAKHIWKLEDTKTLDMEYIKCGKCGYVTGIDGYFLDNVGDVILTCPYCSTKINTKTVIG